MKNKSKITALALCLILAFSIVLTACSGKNKEPEDLVTLTFETNGGTDLSPLSLKAGADIPASAVATTKMFYNFDGWFLEDNDFAYALNIMPSENLKLFARWTPIKSVSVTFEPLGGTVTEKQIIASGDKVTKPGDPIRQNYSFGGWYADESYSEAYDFNSALTLNITLYAKWILKENAAQVTFKGNGQSKPLLEYAVEKGSLISDPKLFGDGIEQTAWTLNSSGSGAAYNFGTQKVESNIVLYANYGSAGLKYSSNQVTSYTGTSSDIIIRNGTEFIGDRAFAGNTKIKTVTIPSTVTQILSGAFAQCTRLNNVVIPDSVTYMDKDVFLGCSSLDKIKLPSGIMSIPQNFLYATAVYEANLSGLTNLTSIGENAFGDCKNLTSVTFPASLNEIGDNAFYNCSSVTGFSLPAGITKIGAGAFAKCTGLTSFNIAGTGKYSVGNESAHEGNGMNLYYTDGGTKELMLYVQGTKTNTSFTIPSDVTKISANAFYGVSNLETVTTAKAGIIFDRGALQGCSGLKVLNLHDWGVTVNGSTVPNLPYIFGAASAQYNMEGNRYTPPSLQTVNFGNTVKIIPAYAFFGCNALTGVNTGASGGFTEVNDSAFAYTGLESFVVGAGLTTFGKNVFEGCYSLKSITNPSGNTKFVTDSDNKSFYYTDTGLGIRTLIKVFAPEENETFINLTVHKDTTSIDSYALSGQLQLKSLTLPFIGQQAAINANSYFSYIFGAPSAALSADFVPELDLLKISGSLSKIPDSAFYNCKITAFDLRASVGQLNEYGEGAFYNNNNIPGRSMKGFVIDDSGNTVSLYNPGNDNFKIGDYAFGQCYLTGDDVTFTGESTPRDGSIEIGDNVTYLGEGAFGYNNFKNVKISAALDEIKPYAFFVNKNLIGAKKAFVENGVTTPVYASKAEIPNTVTKIGAFAFSCYVYDHTNTERSLNGNLEVVFAENGIVTNSLLEQLPANGGSSIAGAFAVSGLNKITLPKTVTVIGSSTFTYCPMEAFKLEDNSILSDIGVGAFANCVFAPGTEIKLPHTLRRITISAFSIQPESIYYPEVKSNLKSVVIGDSVNGSRLMWIMAGAFVGCSSLESITIHKDFKELSESDQNKVNAWKQELEVLDQAYFDVELDEGLTEEQITAERDRIMVEKNRLEDQIAAIQGYNEIPKLTFLITAYGDIYPFEGTHSRFTIRVPSKYVTAFRETESWSSYTSKISGF